MYRQDHFRGQHVAVTGGASGIGLATVEAFSALGATVHLIDRNAELLATGVAGLTAMGRTAHGHVCDITHEADVIAAFDAIAARGPLSVLVNNAGIAIRNDAIALPLADWQKVIDVNLTGAFLCARTAARAMIGHGGGAIVNISSIMGLSGGGIYANPSYQASKGALVNLTRSLAIEWARDNIRVNAVAPTWVKTELTRGLFENPAVLARAMQMTPLGRLAEPEDVANAVLFLSSPASRLITGHILAVDGGFLAQ